MAYPDVSSSYEAKRYDRSMFKYLIKGFSALIVALTFSTTFISTSSASAPESTIELTSLKVDVNITDTSTMSGSISTTGTVESTVSAPNTVLLGSTDLDKPKDSCYRLNSVTERINQPSLGTMRYVIDPSSVVSSKDSAGIEHFSANFKSVISAKGLPTGRFLTDLVVLQNRAGVSKIISTCVNNSLTTPIISYPNYFQVSDNWEKVSPIVSCPQIVDTGSVNFLKDFVFGSKRNVYELCDSKVDFSKAIAVIASGSPKVIDSKSAGIDSSGFNDVCKSSTRLASLGQMKLQTDKSESAKQTFAKVLDDFKNKYPNEEAFYQSLRTRWLNIDSKSEMFQNVIANYCNFDTTRSEDEISKMVESLQTEVAKGAADVSSTIPYLQSLINDKVKLLNPSKPAKSEMKSILCIKVGKSLTVKGEAPKCPAGYKKK